MRIPRRLAFGTLALTFVLAASGAAANGLKLTDRGWLLTSLAGKEPVRGTFVTMRFAGGSLTGSGGCNRYSARYTSSLRTLRLQGPITSTEMACGGGVGVQEQRFTAMLEKARSYAVRGDELTLRDATGKALATFEAQSELAGISWTVTWIRTLTVAPGGKLTLRFSEDGRDVSGHAGCNGFSARLEARPPKLSVGPIAHTMMSCGPYLLEESAYLAAIDAVSSYRIEGAKLELLGANGRIEIRLTRL